MRARWPGKHGCRRLHMKPSADCKEITIRDLAKELALSTATVSRALNNDIKVTEPTRRRVTELAEKTGYRVNDFARILKRNRTNNIGVIVPTLGNYPICTMVSAIEAAAARQGYLVTVMQSHGSKEAEAVCANILFNKRIDGLISLCSPKPGPGHLGLFEQKGIPVILLDGVINNGSFVNILPDYFSAGYNATRHLLSQGRRRIVHITYKEPCAAQMHIRDGCRHAMAEAGLTAQYKYIIGTNVTREACMATAEAIVKWPKQPDAIFAANDHFAIGCLNVLKAKGVCIPGDIAVAGFGNDPVCLAADPGLTTMDYPAHEMGEAAASRLIYQLEGAKLNKKVTTVFLHSQLIVRSSTRPVAPSFNSDRFEPD